MPGTTANRFVRLQCAVALCGTLVLPACAARYAVVPARLSLEPYGRIALVTFSSDQSGNKLSTLATQRFAEALLSSQSGVQLLELSAADSAVGRLDASSDAAAFAQALGRRKNVPAVFVGQLSVSRAQPHGRIGAAAGVNVRASVTTELTVRLLSTESGATVWRSSARATRTVGQVAITGGRPSVALRNPDDAYDQAVYAMVADVTRDLRPTRVKQ